ncbi:ATP-citrate synthase alpha chain protein 1-like protein [Tanacetum coccineum]
MFSCSLASELVRKVMNWWDIGYPELGSYVDWLSWFKQLHINSKAKKVLEGILYVMWLQIWRFRNKTLFGKNTLKKATLFDDLVTLIFQWCNARCKANMSWSGSGPARLLLLRLVVDVIVGRTIVGKQWFGLVVVEKFGYIAFVVAISIGQITFVRAAESVSGAEANVDWGRDGQIFMFNPDYLYEQFAGVWTSAKDWLLMHVLVVWAITRNSMFPVLSCMAWDILSVQSFFGSIDQHFQQVAGLLTIEEHGLNSGVFRRRKMARKKIREYDSKRLVKEHFNRISGSDLPIKSAQVTVSTDFNELVEREPWLSSSKLVVKPDMLFGKRGKSGLVALNLDLAQVAEFVKERLGKEVEMGGCKGPITTFIVEPFVPHNEEFYINIVSERLGCSISFSECGGIDIEENWDKVKTIFLPTGVSLSQEICAPLVATLPLEFKTVIEDFIKHTYSLFIDLDFTFLEMNPFTLVEGKPYPLDMRGELDDTAAFKNFKKWGNIEFPMPFGRVMSSTESFIHGLDEKTSASLKFTVLNPKGRIWTMVAGGGASVIYADTVGDLGYASELGNYAEYSGAPNEDEVLQYARVVIDCATADPDGQRRALVVGGGIANFTDVAATFNGIIRAMKEKESKLKAANMHIYVRRGGPNYQRGLARMRALGAELGIPIEVYGPEATMTGICKQAIECITVAA